MTPASDCPRNDLEPAGPSAIALAIDPCVSTSRFRADEASPPGDSNVKMKSFDPDSPEPVTRCRINSPFSETKMPLAESTYRVPVVSCPTPTIAPSVIGLGASGSHALSVAAPSMAEPPWPTFVQVLPPVPRPPLKLIFDLKHPMLSPTATIAGTRRTCRRMTRRIEQLSDQGRLPITSGRRESGLKKLTSDQLSLMSREGPPAQERRRISGSSPRTARKRRDTCVVATESASRGSVDPLRGDNSGGVERDHEGGASVLLGNYRRDCAADHTEAAVKQRAGRRAVLTQVLSLLIYAAAGREPARVGLTRRRERRARPGTRLFRLYLAHHSLRTRSSTAGNARRNHFAVRRAGRGVGDDGADPLSDRTLRHELISTAIRAASERRRGTTVALPARRSVSSSSTYSAVHCGRRTAPVAEANGHDGQHEREPSPAVARDRLHEM
jgi:hypothetical protein